MGLFSSNKSVAKVEIILGEDKTCTVNVDSSLSIQTILFIYYFDRILINERTNIQELLLADFDNMSSAIGDDFMRNPRKRPARDLGTYFPGLNFSIDKPVQGRELFKAQGNLMRKGNGLLMQTTFKPLFINNGQAEEYAADTVFLFYASIISKATPAIRFILGSLINHAVDMYEKSGIHINEIGLIPSTSLAAVVDLEKDKQSDWLEDAKKLFNN